MPPFLLLLYSGMPNKTNNNQPFFFLIESYLCRTSYHSSHTNSHFPDFWLFIFGKLITHTNEMRMIQEIKKGGGDIRERMKGWIGIFKCRFLAHCKVLYWPDSSHSLSSLFQPSSFPNLFSTVISLLTTQACLDKSVWLLLVLFDLGGGDKYK